MREDGEERGERGMGRRGLREGWGGGRGEGRGGDGEEGEERCARGVGRRDKRVLRGGRGERRTWARRDRPECRSHRPSYM